MSKSNITANEFISYVAGCAHTTISAEDLRKLLDTMPRKKVDGEFEPGDRVFVKASAGFSRGSVGVIKYIEPHSNNIWVLRDGAASDIRFLRDELGHARG